MNPVDLTRAVPSAPQHAEQALAQLEGGKVVDGLAAERQDEKRTADTATSGRGVAPKLPATDKASPRVPEPGSRELAQQLEEAANIANFLNRSLSFEVDREIKRVVISVVETDTKTGGKKVIRKIPPEQMIKVLKHLNQVRGLLLDAEG